MKTAYWKYFFKGPFNLGLLLFTLPILSAPQPNLVKIGTEYAWALGYTGKGQTIAILDTGIDINHPWLRGRVVDGACFSSSAPMHGVYSVCNPGTRNGVPEAGMACNFNGCEHGTHVAGIAAGRKGVAKDANIMAIQVYSRSYNRWVCERQGMTTPCLYLNPANFIEGLQYIYDNRGNYNIAAINLSMTAGGRFAQQFCDVLVSSNESTRKQIKESIDQLTAVGIAVVGASGNSANEINSNGIVSKPGIAFPACLSNVVSVGAIDANDIVAFESQFAPILNLLAPGVGILSANAGGGIRVDIGTSMAAPHVTGAWAVLKSSKPTATVNEIGLALQVTGIEIADYHDGWITPRIQVDDALEFLANNDFLPLDQFSVKGNTVRKRPVFKWIAAPQAVKYYLYIHDLRTDRVAVRPQFLTPLQANCFSIGGLCRTQLPFDLPLGRYKWWVAAIYPSDNRWSAGQTFNRI